jgi:two-component system, OmpR family, sensor histidine kinase QseC
MLKMNWILKRNHSERHFNTSIQKFLFFSSIGVVCLGLLLTFVVNRFIFLDEVSEVYDAQLAQTSRILRGFLNRSIKEVDLENMNNQLFEAVNLINKKEDDYKDSQGHGYERKLAVQLLDIEGNLLVKTPSAPMYSLAPLQEGYSTKNHDNYKWYSFTDYMEESKLWLVVSEREDIRQELINKTLLSSLFSMSIVALIIGGLMVAVVKSGIKPLTLLSMQLQTRHIDKLDSIEDLPNMPEELKPLVGSINHLMSRVALDLERERQFLGDIAHELRNPLSVLKLNAQVGLTTQDLTTSKKNFTKIVQGVDRSVRMVNQLLTLARLDPRALGTKKIIQLSEIMLDVLQEFNVDNENLSRIKDHDFRITENFLALKIEGYPLLIDVMLRNLLENACHYSPVNTCITVDGGVLTQGDLFISVADQGPGVSESRLMFLGKRFFREAAADTTGTGLGLSIVSKIVEIHGATIEFNNLSPRGFLVKIIFSH